MGAFSQTYHPLFLVLCVALAACHAGASLPQAETPVPHLASQNLRALGTSFSQKISKALKQHRGEHQARTASVDDDDAPINVYWHENKKPTMGDWFQKLLTDMNKQFESQHEQYSGPEGYREDQDSGPYDQHGQHKQYPGHGRDDHYYGRDQHQQDYYKQQGPEHEQYYGPDMQQYERYYQQYKEQYSYNDGKADQSCMQEMARKNCLLANSSTTTTNDDTLHFSSSLGCCFSTDNHDRYYEDSSYSGEPDYPPYAALMMQRTHQQARAARSSLRSSKGSAVSTSATTAAATYYDTPTVFYPRGGSSECVWRLAYHEPVQVDATTAQIGIASATCHFNGSMEHCHGLSLGSGAIFTLQGDIYKTTSAVSKYAPANTSLSADCAADPKRRLEAPRSKAKIALPVSAPVNAAQPVTPLHMQSQPIITRPLPQAAPHIPPPHHQQQQQPQLPAVQQPTTPTNQPIAAANAQKPSAVAPPVSTPIPAVQQPAVQVPSQQKQDKQPAQDPAVQKPVQQPSTTSPLPAVPKPTKQERSPARTAMTKSVKTAAAKPTYDYRSRYQPDSGYAGEQHSGEGYGMEGPYKEISYSRDANKPSGMYGGEAIIITAAITSFTGLEKTFEYQHGMVEFVAAFTGTPLTNAAYEALPYDVPHIKPGGYKLVLVGDESHY